MKKNRLLIILVLLFGGCYYSPYYANPFDYTTGNQDQVDRLIRQRKKIADDVAYERRLENRRRYWQQETTNSILRQHNTNHILRGY